MANFHLAANPFASLGLGRRRKRHLNNEPFQLSSSPSDFSRPALSRLSGLSAGWLVRASTLVLAAVLRAGRALARPNESPQLLAASETTLESFARQQLIRAVCLFITPPVPSSTGATFELAFASIRRRRRAARVCVCVSAANFARSLARGPNVQPIKAPAEQLLTCIKLPSERRGCLNLRAHE